MVLVMFCQNGKNREDDRKALKRQFAKKFFISSLEDMNLFSHNYLRYAFHWNAFLLLSNFELIAC